MTQLVVQGLLFDLDGTLVDSTASVERNWQKLAAGIDMPWEDIADWIHGIPVRQVLARLRPDMDPDEIEHWHQFMFEAESTDTGDVMPIPGAIESLDHLPLNRWAIVTSGGVRLATSRMRAAGLPQPKYLVTADDVSLGKPDPAPYLMGAQKLGVPPAQCLAFEDAPAGVASAQAAGVPVIGIATNHRDLGVPMVRNLTEVEFSADRLGVIVTY
ncbi:HAD-IA family hydrolase [Nakamurella sp. YIM 132087]|uniref:HAD-IA family hydrolase n=1 Tax=Nakamurella alba TaxID=2665158 RepID=A0A7K1FEP6_9ACTN|nr:HAD-IA family hydrolase [Nakamurella alba]MTD12571.1 HAD-IA family hydrolase [Nakamurella alba]